MTDQYTEEFEAARKSTFRELQPLFEAVFDAVDMLKTVDSYDRLPAYGRGKQYHAAALQLQRLLVAYKISRADRAVCAKCGTVEVMLTTHVMPDGWEQDGMGDCYCGPCMKPIHAALKKIAADKV